MHISELVFKASKRLGMLRHMRGNLTVYTANAVYVSFIHPIMEYCDTIWNCCRLSYSTLSEKIQWHAAKIITKERSDDTMEMLKWPLLEKGGGIILMNWWKNVCQSNILSILRTILHLITRGRLYKTRISYPVDKPIQPINLLPIG